MTHSYNPNRDPKGRFARHSGSDSEVDLDRRSAISSEQCDLGYSPERTGPRGINGEVSPCSEKIGFIKLSIPYSTLKKIGLFSKLQSKRPVGRYWDKAKSVWMLPDSFETEKMLDEFGITVNFDSLSENERMISREEGERAYHRQLRKNEEWRRIRELGYSYKDKDEESHSYNFDPNSDDEYDAWRDGEIKIDGEYHHEYRARLGRERNRRNWSEVARRTRKN